MTSGTRITDLRMLTNTYCGSGLAGQYAQKSWSGADQSSSSPPNRVVVYKREYRLEPYITKKGERRIRKVHLKTHEQTVIRSKPRRARHYDEHNYSMTASMYNNGALEFYDPYAVPPVWRVGTYATCFGTPTRQATTWDANDDLKLINKIRPRLVGDDFNVGVFLAELPQAAQMIANAASRIDKAMRYARKGNFWLAEEVLVSGTITRAGLNRRQGAANNWLELQYGWKPLLNDAYAGAQMLSHMAGEPFVNVIRVRVKKTGTRGYDTNNTTRVFKKNGMEEMKSLKAMIREVDVYKLTGLTDPASILWEKLPWSFVADWFIPIGNYLSARGVASSVTGTFVTSYKRRWWASGLYGTAPWYILDSSKISWESVALDRTITSSINVPLPAFKPLGKIASWAHAANAVALLTQKFK